MSTSSRLSRWNGLFLLALAACSTQAPRTLPPPAPRAPAAAAGTESTPQGHAPIEVERRWLQAWFKDTPVQIALRGEDVLGVDIPREFSFDAGSSRIKPPLAAVLDKVAESLRRQPQLRLQGLAAPGAGTDAVLAVPRGVQVRRHLCSRGVPEARLAAPVRSGVDAVQLRLAVASH